MEEGAEGGEVVKWMDGFAFGGRLGGGEVGFDWRGVGWDEFFCFSFSARLRWILWAVNDVVQVVGRGAYIYSYVQKQTLLYHIGHRCHNHHEQPTTKSKDISTPPPPSTTPKKTSKSPTTNPPTLNSQSPNISHNPSNPTPPSPKTPPKSSSNPSRLQAATPAYESACPPRY